jgi:hypothetical protein
VVFLGKDAETREGLLAEIKDLRTRRAETEEALLAARKSRNNHVRKEAEDEIRWAKERNHERARADELLQFEKVEHRHSEEELGKTRDQLRDVSFRQRGNESRRRFMTVSGNIGPRLNCEWKEFLTSLVKRSLPLCRISFPLSR